MNWIKIEEKLPPKNTLVWVKRMPNKIEKDPIYLAMRNGQDLSINPDASTNCYWYGINKHRINEEQEKTWEFNFPSSFSDVTVIEWAFIELND